MINFKHSSPQIVDTDLAVVEERFGFAFPVGFRELYLRFNGGRPEKDRFVTETGTYTIDRFLPIRYGKAGLTLEDDIQDMKVERKLLPEHLVEFALDPGGDYYCFSTRDNEYGAIYLFRMDANPGRNAELLSPGLNEFLGSLRSRGDVKSAKPRP